MSVENFVEQTYDSTPSTSHSHRKSVDNLWQMGVPITSMPTTADNCEKDEFDTFGEYVALVLRKLKTDYAKCTVKHHINNILYQGEIGMYDLSPNYDFEHNSHRKPSSSSTSHAIPSTSSQDNCVDHTESSR